jgi:hypothetical protein
MRGRAFEYCAVMLNDMASSAPLAAVPIAISNFRVRATAIKVTEK